MTEIIFMEMIEFVFSMICAVQIWQDVKEIKASSKILTWINYVMSMLIISSVGVVCAVLFSKPIEYNALGWIWHMITGAECAVDTVGVFLMAVHWLYRKRYG